MIDKLTPPRGSIDKQVTMMNMARYTSDLARQERFIKFLVFAMASSLYMAILQAFCVFWFILDLCWTVAAEEFCVRTCNCTNIQDGTPKVWPEAVAASAGAAAPVVLGGAGFAIKKLISGSSSKSLNVSNMNSALINRKGSMPESLSSAGYDNYKRRQSTLTMFDNDDDDFGYDGDYPRKSSVPSFSGDDGPAWSSTPRGAPMARPSFLPSQSVGPAAASGINSWM